MENQQTNLVTTQPEILEVHRKLADPQYLQLIKDTYCQGASDLEFALAIETARHLGLDPVARQIYFIKAWDSQLRATKLVTIIGIDGLRLGAERTGLYAGQTEPLWCGRDGVWTDVWLGEGPPAAAKVGVLRRDFAQPVWGVVKYQSFVIRAKDGRPRAQWGTMPDHMLAKCAEAQALRKAFPQELSGDYHVKDAEPNEESGGFRIKDQTPEADLPTVAELTEAIATAETKAELQTATDRLRGMELTDAERQAAADAWAGARDRLAKNVSRETKRNGTKKSNGKSKTAKPKAEPAPTAEPTGEHDYGPPAWDETSVAEGAAMVDASPVEQSDFGFDDAGQK